MLILARIRLQFNIEMQPEYEIVAIFKIAKLSFVFALHIVQL